MTLTPTASTPPRSSVRSVVEMKSRSILPSMMLDWKLPSRDAERFNTASGNRALRREVIVGLISITCREVLMPPATSHPEVQGPAHSCQRCPAARQYCGPESLLYHRQRFAASAIAAPCCEQDPGRRSGRYRQAERDGCQRGSPVRAAFERVESEGRRARLR